MSILGRLNPLRIVGTADEVPHLRRLGEKVRDDQKEMTRRSAWMKARGAGCS